MAEPDIVAFIQARLAEDEQLAREATPGRWEAFSNNPDVGFEIAADQSPAHRPKTQKRWVVGGESGGGVYDEPDANHIARHHPARVLAEIAAKRRVLARHCRADRADHIYRERIPIYMCVGCEYEPTWDDPQPRTPDINDCPELRDLAAIWNGHPDYQERWKTDD